MNDAHDMKPEFSRPFHVANLGAHPVRRDIEASADECRALAERFGLERLDRLGATLVVERAAGGMIRLSGTFSALVVQSCVVTLEPVVSTIEENVAALYRPHAAPTDNGVAEREVVVEVDDEGPEPLEGGAIDLGETVAQHLALALDPYPRAPGARFAAVADGAPEEAAPDNPFHALAALKSGS